MSLWNQRGQNHFVFHLVALTSPPISKSKVLLPGYGWPHRRRPASADFQQLCKIKLTLTPLIVIRLQQNRPTSITFHNGPSSPYH
jgi:hypothetical protein